MLVSLALEFVLLPIVQRNRARPLERSNTKLLGSPQPIMTTITLNGNVVRPATQQEGGSQFAADASHSNYILVHCVNRLNNEQYDDLKRLQVNVLQYIATNTYLCRFLPTELEEIRRLTFVEYANVYHPDLVVESALQAKAAFVSNRQTSPANDEIPSGEHTSRAQGDTTADETLYEVYVVLHPQSDRSPKEIKSRLIERLEVDPDEIHTHENRLVMKIRPQDLHEVARLDEVQTIEELAKDELHNHIARQDLKLVNQPSLFPEYSPAVYSARGQLIAVADSGIDDTHPAFTGRILPPISFRGGNGALTPPNSNNDVSGHGTHVAASVMGSYISPEFGYIDGTAPGARVVMLTISGLKEMLYERASHNGLRDLYQSAFDKGAKVLNNSWGAPPAKRDPADPKLSEYIQAGYTQDSLDADAFMKANSDFLIVCSSGNSGHLPTGADGQIGAQAAAKNVLTVGSTESSRRLQGQANNRKALIYDPSGTTDGDPTNVFYTSSKGPTKGDHRAKPDVVAPGLAICSARSQDPELTWGQTADGRSNNLNLYGKIIDDQDRDLDKRSIFSSGTSMAAPLVSGCCAVIRSCLTDQINPIPAALVKAILINGAVDIQGEHVRGPTPIGQPPNAVQGFGRVNLSKSLQSVVRSTSGGFLPIGGQSHRLKKLDRWSKTIALPIPPDDPSVDSTQTPTKMPMTLSITMCYADAPGAFENGNLINQLSLKVVADDKDQTTRYGNTGNTNVDATNNVQKLVWLNIGGTFVKFVVTCEEFGQGASDPGQDFYLAYRFDYGPPQNDAAVWNNLNGYLPPQKAILTFKALMAARNAASN